jgi:hypothetical protein
MSLRLRLAIGASLIALGISFLPAPLLARRAITFVEGAYSPSQVNDNAITLASNVAGDVVVVIAGIAQSAQTLTISDDATHTWTRCPDTTQTHVTSTAIEGESWFTVVTSDITTITLTSSSTGATFGGAVVYSGMGSVTCDATDTDLDDDGVQTQGDGISVAPTTTNDTLMVGGLVNAGTINFDTFPSGYTDIGTPIATMFMGYKVVNSTSANTFVTTSAQIEDSITTLVAIKSSVAAGGGGTTCLGTLLGVGC